jgi:GTP-binding protein HflX
VYTLTDTVGFVRHLPHDLVEAFASTLEESAQADLLLHVVDASDPDPDGQISAVRAVLSDIGAGDLPELIVLNKADQADPSALTTLRTTYPGAVIASARTGQGLDDVRAAVESRLPRPEVVVRVLLPYERGDLLNRIHQAGEILSLEHTEDGTVVNARVLGSLAGELAPYHLAASGSPAS